MHRTGFAALALSFLAAAAVLPLDAPPLSLFACPWRAATGLPCLTCGCTHAFHFFVRGAWSASLQSSPLGFLLAFACAAFVVLTVFRVELRKPPLSARAARWMAFVGLAANWAFVALRTAP